MLRGARFCRTCLIAASYMLLAGVGLVGAAVDSLVRTELTVEVVTSLSIAAIEYLRAQE